MPLSRSSGVFQHSIDRFSKRLFSLEWHNWFMAKRKSGTELEAAVVEAKSNKAECGVHFDQSNKLDSEFFNRPCEELAKKLLGKILVRVVSSEGKDIELGARIVETEAYLGGEDKASHSYNGKKTKRNSAMFMAPGTAYVYSIYGIYVCFNVSSAGEGAAVLVRAVEPLVGIEHMEKLRAERRTGRAKPLQLKELSNGPSKLCQAMKITKELDCHDMPTSDNFYFIDDGKEYGDDEVVQRPRVGIAYAEEWTDKLLRFYSLENKFVSVK